MIRVRRAPKAGAKMSEAEEYRNSLNYSFADSWEEADLGGERITRWPSSVGECRGISVTISNWAGHTPDAKHVDVAVEEVCNQYWSEQRNRWVKVECCSRSRGLSMRAETLFKKDAIDIAKAYLKTVDPTGKTHVVSWLWCGPEAPQWIKRRKE